MSPPDELEYVMHTRAVMAARIAVGLEPLPESPDDSWWETGPHLEVDGRSYFVHAMGCLQAQLGRAMRDHPDWYLVGIVVRGANCEIRGLASDQRVTLGTVSETAENLTPDETRLAIELTNREKRRGWGSHE